MSGHYSYPLTEQRERKLERLVEKTGASTKAEALDDAIGHYLWCHEHWPDVAHEITPEQADKISSPLLALRYYPQVR